MLQFNYKLVPINIFLFLFCCLFCFNNYISAANITKFNVFTETENRIFDATIYNHSTQIKPYALFNVQFNLTKMFNISTLQQLKQLYKSCNFKNFLFSAKLIKMPGKVVEIDLNTQHIDDGILFKNLKYGDQNINIYECSSNDNQSKFRISIGVNCQVFQEELFLIIGYYGLGYTPIDKHFLLTVSATREMEFHCIKNRTKR